MKDDDKATISFELDASRLIKDLRELDFPLSQFQNNLPRFMRQIKLDELERVYGMFSLSQELDDYLQLRPGDVPLECFVRIRFTNPDAADNVLEELRKRSDEIELNGIKFLVESETRTNLLAHQSDMNEIEFGTRKFVLQSDRQLMSAKLTQAWQRLPLETFRVAIDTKANETLIKQGITWLEKSAPSTAKGFIQLLDNSDQLIASAGLKSKQLLRCTITGSDTTNTEELKAGIDELVELGKQSIAAASGSSDREVSTRVTLVGTLLNQLTVKQDQLEIQLALPLPAKVLEIVKKSTARTKGQARRNEQRNRFKLLALACQNYHSANQKFPFARNAARQSDLSWRVRILSYIGQGEMFDRVDLEQGAKDQSNAQFANKMPRVFGNDGRNANVAWIQSDAASFRDVTDGSSNTVMLIEDRQGKPWLKDNSFSVEEAIKAVKSLPDGDFLTVALYDGSIQELGNKISKVTLRSLFTPDDNNRVDWDEIRKQIRDR